MNSAESSRVSASCGSHYIAALCQRNPGYYIRTMPTQFRQYLSDEQSLLTYFTILDLTIKRPTIRSLNLRQRVRSARKPSVIEWRCQMADWGVGKFSNAYYPNLTSHLPKPTRQQSLELAEDPNECSAASRSLSAQISHSDKKSATSQHAGLSCAESCTQVVVSNTSSLFDRQHEL